MNVRQNRNLNDNVKYRLRSNSKYFNSNRITKWIENNKNFVKKPSVKNRIIINKNHNNGHNNLNSVTNNLNKNDKYFDFNRIQSWVEHNKIFNSRNNRANNLRRNESSNKLDRNISNHNKLYSIVNKEKNKIEKILNEKAKNDELIKIRAVKELINNYDKVIRKKNYTDVEIVKERKIDNNNQIMKCL